MKHIKHWLATMAVLLCSITASAHDFEVGGIYYYITSVEELTVAVTYKGNNSSSYSNEYSGNITIPSTIAYNGKTYSVTSIGNAAFHWCSSLTSITIPEGVTSIGWEAFHMCTNLTSITLPENSQLTSIGERAFEGCSSLTSITIPEGVTSIRDYAFSGCYGLTSITIPEKSQLTKIGYAAFHTCSCLTSITIPASVTDMGDYAFCWCEKLNSIIVAEGNVIYDSRENCNAIIKTENNTLISGCATTIIPASVTSIDVSAFEGCSSLTSITIPESVTSIGNYAFSGCSSLTTIVLPKSNNHIGNEAFANCAELLDVYCYAENVPSTGADAFDGSYPERATLHVPASALDTYKNTAPWSSFGEFEAFEITVENITLSQSTATLTEGETLVLTATVAPDDAADKSISWSSSNPSVATIDNTGKVTAVALGIASITATANDGSGVSASCEVEVKEKLLGKCATPVVNYVDGKVMLTCETEGAKVITDVVAEDAQRYEGLEIALSATYTITAYATKEGYLDSETTTVTLCWVPCDENHGGETDIINIPSKPVLIQTDGGTITVNGLAEGTVVKVNGLNGVELGTATAIGGTATITTGLTTGSVAVVQMGEYSVKVVIK